MRPIVFDTFAVVAWLRKEPHSTHVNELMRQIASGEVGGGICLVNLGEVYYIIARKEGIATAERVLSELLELDWAIYPVPHQLTMVAARLKARCPISYADAFALACAQEHDAALVTGDPEILAADHGIPILWPGVGKTPKE